MQDTPSHLTDRQLTKMLNGLVGVAHVTVRVLGTSAAVEREIADLLRAANITFQVTRLEEVAPFPLEAISLQYRGDQAVMTVCVPLL